MAASRREKIGSIFTRFTGLLRSGAISEVDKPVWYDVYRAFPPAVEPKLNQEEPNKEIPNLLYPEDIVRAKFYSTYGNPDVVDLTNENIKTTCQKLVEKYFELQEKGELPEEKIFSAAIDSLKSEGIRLRTLAEKETELLEQSPTSARNQNPAATDVDTNIQMAIDQDAKTSGEFIIDNVKKNEIDNK